MDAEKEKELERQARIEASLREREREVQRARSEQTKEIDREREQHKREEAIQSFKALMSDMVSTLMGLHCSAISNMVIIININNAFKTVRLQQSVL